MFYSLAQNTHTCLPRCMQQKWTMQQYTTNIIGVLVEFLLHRSYIIISCYIRLYIAYFNIPSIPKTLIIILFSFYHISVCVCVCARMRMDIFQIVDLSCFLGHKDLLQIDNIILPSALSRISLGVDNGTIFCIMKFYKRVLCATNTTIEWS